MSNSRRVRWLVVAGLLSLTAPASAEAASYPPARTISNEGGRAYSPQIVAHGGSSATAIWQLGFDSIEGLQIGMSDELGPIQELSSPEAASIFDVTLVGDAAGNALVVSTTEFKTPSGGRVGTVEAGRLASDGNVSTFTVVPSEFEPANLSVAMNSQGLGLIVWDGAPRRNSPAVTRRIGARWFNRNGDLDRWQYQLTSNGLQPEVAVGERSRGIVAWSKANGGDQAQDFTHRGLGRPDAQDLGRHERTSLAGAAWGAAERPVVFQRRFSDSKEDLFAYGFGGENPTAIRVALARARGHVSRPSSAVAPDGRIAVAWDETFGEDKPGRTRQRIRFAWLSPTGKLISAETVSQRGADAADVDVATGPNGDAAVVWENENDHSIRVADIDRRGRPGSVMTVSTDGARSDSAQIEIDSRGRRLVVWHSRIEGEGDVVQLARSEG